jgi:hypothetical protein
MAKEKKFLAAFPKEKINGQPGVKTAVASFLGGNPGFCRPFAFGWPRPTDGIETERHQASTYPPPPHICLSYVPVKRGEKSHLLVSISTQRSSGKDAANNLGANLGPTHEAAEESKRKSSLIEEAAIFSLFFNPAKSPNRQENILLDGISHPKINLQNKIQIQASHTKKGEKAWLLASREPISTMSMAIKTI